MVKSLENGTSLPPFLVKCYEMVSDESTDGLISWTESNDSFIIWNESEFSSRLLPKYFKHSNFSSFVRQLNIYGFRKVDTDRWQFANESFIKGQKHLLKNITRRKQPQNVLPKKSSQQKEDPPVVPKGEGRTDLWKEVESLKTDKNALMQELKKLRQHQQMSQNKLQLLREQLKGMEKNQQQMLSFIVMAMQSPEFLVQFFQPKENNWLMAAETGKSKLSEVMDDGEPVPSEGMIVPYQPPKDGPSTTECAMEASTPEDLMELDFSADEMRDLFVNIDFLLGPLDEKLLPLENPTQIVLPDILESDTMLEQLLLSEPSDDNGQLPEFETEAYTDSIVQMGSTFHLREADNSNGSDNDANACVNQITVAMTTQSLCDDCEKVEVSTKQMEYLNSEIGFEH